MGKIIRNGIEYGGTSDSATSVNYDNSVSGLNARTVQEGIDQLNESLGGLEFTVVDGQPQWKERGADTFNPFKSGSGWFRTGTITVAGQATKTVTLSCSDYANYKNITVDNIKVGIQSFSNTSGSWANYNGNISVSNYDATTGTITISAYFMNNTAVSVVYDYIVCIV